VAEPDRATARDLARRHVADGDPLGWFEVLYASAGDDASSIPWADLAPNPNLLDWLDEQCVSGSSRRALKVGCGLGDDAEELSRRGFATVAFDISPSAVRWCRERFPESSVLYVEADLLQPPTQWVRAFDFVLESYTLQVLPLALRQEAIHRLADFVAPGGTLLLITRGASRLSRKARCLGRSRDKNCWSSLRPASPSFNSMTTRTTRARQCAGFE
jgi:SAM-dependent methyltransferase